MASSDGRMDDLLARTLAQREVLGILVRLALPAQEERLLASRDASEGFEKIYAAEPVTTRVRQSIDCGLNELEQIFQLAEADEISGSAAPLLRR